MNLEQIIDQWIEKEKVSSLNMIDDEHLHFTVAYNQALQDLKSRKQELVEGIGRIIDGTKVDVVSEFGTSRRDAYGFKKEILRKLTGK